MSNKWSLIFRKNLDFRRLYSNKYYSQGIKDLKNFQENKYSNFLLREGSLGKVCFIKGFQRSRDWNDNHSFIGEKSLLYSLAFISIAFTMDDNQSGKVEDVAKGIISTADSLYENNKTAELYEHLSKHAESKDAEILWRYARSARDYSALSSTPSELKKKLIYEGFEAAQEAVKLGPEHFACHKWYGIMLSEVGDFEGTKKKITDSYKIRDHFKKAIELNATDATSHYLLGVWFFTFADLPWYQRKLAATIFASPPSCTYEEAQNCFLHAESIDPGFYAANQLMLAKTYLKMGNKEQAKEWFTKVLNYDAKTEDDKENIKKAEDFLKSL